MCLLFFSFSFCLFLSFIRPKPSRLFLHPSLLPQHNSKRMCVVIPSGLLCPTAPLPFLMLPPLLRQRLRKPPSWLSPLSPVQLTAAGTFGLLTSALFSPPYFLSPCPSLSLTCVTPSPCRNFNPFCHKKDKKKKRKSLCVIFPREEVTRTFFLYSDPCVFTTGAQQIYLLAHKRSSHLLKQGRIAPDITPAHNQIKRYR